MGFNILCSGPHWAIYFVRWWLGPQPAGADSWLDVTSTTEFCMDSHLPQASGDTWMGWCRRTGARRLECLKHPSGQQGRQPRAGENVKKRQAGIKEKRLRGCIPKC
ncbi:uncharacterized protein LOC144221314 [Crocuta crocuta]